jgi:hypothetical protein
MDRQSIITAGQAESQRMRASVAEADPEGQVQMSVAQFARLADLIATLASQDEPATEAGATEPAAPGDPRYWVPLAHFARLKARCDALERLASCGALGLAA